MSDTAIAPAPSTNGSQDADDDQNVEQNLAPVIPTFDEEEPPIPFRVREKGIETEYEIRQFESANDKNNGGGLACWMRSINKRNTFDTTGKLVSTNFNGFHEELISLCCYRKGEEDRVPKAVIAKWSPKARTFAFDAAQRINGLKEDQKTAQGKV